MSAQLVAAVKMSATKPYLPPFHFVAAGDMPIKPIAWLIDKYIERDAFAVMFGPPGKGKSFVALGLACCIATGEDFHGLAVQQGAVFCIAGEGHNGLARRLRAWSQYNGIDLKGAPLFVSDGATEFANTSNATQVAMAVQDLADKTGQTPVLIVIDTLARNFGGDENSATEVGNFIRHVDTHLRQKWRATVLIVHHSGKDGDRGARGSSALKGAADAEYEVSRNDDDKVIRLTPRKMKDAEEPVPLAFEMVNVSLLDNTGNPVSGAALKLTEYVSPALSSTSGMGKNQQKALAALELLHEEITTCLAEQGRQEQSVLIEQEHWHQRCEAEGIARNRYKEARDALLKRGAIRLDGPHVFLLTNSVRNVRTP